MEKKQFNVHVNLPPVGTVVPKGKNEKTNGKAEYIEIVDGKEHYHTHASLESGVLGIPDILFFKAKSFKDSKNKYFIFRMITNHGSLPYHILQNRYYKVPFEHIRRNDYEAEGCYRLKSDIPLTENVFFDWRYFIKEWLPSILAGLMFVVVGWQAIISTLDYTYKKNQDAKKEQKVIDFSIIIP